MILLQCRCFMPWCYCPASCKISRCSLKCFEESPKLEAFCVIPQKMVSDKKGGENLLLAKPLSLKSLKTAAVVCLCCCLTCKLELWPLAERLGSVCSCKALLHVVADCLHFYLCFTILGSFGKLQNQLCALLALSGFVKKKSW